jgi:diguanylate cyclase (GGDEF)-like protein/PAS domain S-box-containing protein
MVILEQDDRIHLANLEFEHLSGYSSQDLPYKKKWTEFVIGDDWDEIQSLVTPKRGDGGSVPKHEIRLVDRHGIVKNVLLTVVRIPDTQMRLVTLVDFTERKREEEAIRHMAYRDALTGLPNRVVFTDRLQVALSRAKRNQVRLAVLLLDLDRFKDINDTLGHTVGDQLLQAVGNRLPGLLRSSDTVARLGGDEFIILLPDIAQAHDGPSVARKILRAFQKPFSVNRRNVHVTPSIGIAIYPDNAEDSDTLMKNADLAMYRAKERGRNNYQCYTPAINQIRLPFMYVSRPDP